VGWSGWCGTTIKYDYKYFIIVTAKTISKHTRILPINTLPFETLPYINVKFNIWKHIFWKSHKMCEVKKR